MPKRRDFSLYLKHDKTIALFNAARHLANALGYSGVTAYIEHLLEGDLARATEHTNSELVPSIQHALSFCPEANLAVHKAIKQKAANNGL